MLQRETRIFQPTLIEEISRTVRPSDPDHHWYCIDSESKVIFGLLQLGIEQRLRSLSEPL
jgi:hypothetical protein